MRPRRMDLVRVAVLLALIAAGAILVAGRRRAPKPLAPPETPPAAAASASGVEFRPTSDGAHTVWLVAGPFDKPLTAPEKLGQAREGAALAGRSWKLLTSPNAGVELSGQGGVFYASGALLSPAGGPRELRVRSYGPARVWLAGAPAGAAAPDGYWGGHTGSFEVNLGRGENRLLVECVSAGGKAGFALILGQRAADPDSPGRSQPASERLALALADAGPARLAGLLARATALRPADAWMTPGKPIELRLERSGSAPELKGELDLRLLARPDAAVAPGEQPGPARRVAAAELLAGAVAVTMPAPAESCLALECVAELATAGGGRALGSASCVVYSREGLEDEARKLFADSLTAAHGVRGDALALAHLKGEKALLGLSGYSPGAGEARAALEELVAGRAALVAGAKGQDPLAGQIGWLERAYRCPTDGSAQPYRLYVPRALADPAERQEGALPLIVYLHGYIPDYDKHAWVEENQMRDFCALADRFGAILLLPFGRSNTDFVSIGEVDVLRAIEETCRLYPVDRDRVSLCGYSMGGYGAYAVAAHFPDRFATLAVLSGRPVPYYVEQRGRAGQPRYKGWCLDADTPLELALSFRGLPVTILHGRDDFIPFESAEAMAGRLKAAGAAVEFKELKGGHWSGFEALASPETVTWMLSHSRPKRPAKVTIRAFSPRFASAHWARIELIDKWTGPAELVAADRGKGLVEVSAKNVREFVLRGVVGAPATGEVQPSVRGAENFNLEYANRAGKGGWEIRGRLKSAPREGRWVKNALLPGPMKEACNTPFMAVWGSAGSLEETAANESKARRFATEWHRFAKGLPQAVDERTLTEAEKKSKSLILFGTPETSRLAAEAAPGLGCRLTADEFEVAGKQVSLKGDRGLVLTRPSPWAPANDRYLVLCAGRFYGDDRDHPALNHKLDLIPDFIVFTAGSEGEGEPPALLAGYFDSDWKPDPALVEVFEPKPKAVEEEAPALGPVRVRPRSSLQPVPGAAE